MRKNTRDERGMMVVCVDEMSGGPLVGDWSTGTAWGAVVSHYPPANLVERYDSCRFDDTYFRKRRGTSQRQSISINIYLFEECCWYSSKINNPSFLRLDRNSLSFPLPYHLPFIIRFDGMFPKLLMSANEK